MIGFGLAILSSAVLAAGAAYAPIQGAPPVYREIKDWVLACDNTHACMAKYVAADEGDGGGGYLSVERGAGAEGRLTVTVETVNGDNTPNPATLRLDGRPLTGFAWSIDAKAQTATLAGDPALRFVRAIRDGGKLAYAGGKTAPYVGLTGMKAALWPWTRTRAGWAMKAP